MTKQPGVGQVTSTDHRKTPGEECADCEKRPGGCEECSDCGECEAEIRLTKLRRQNSLVMRVDRRVQALLEKALAS